MKYYAGIGSRRTPENICQIMTKIARYLYTKDYVLRSGDADGADTTFKNGVGDKKEIFFTMAKF